MFEQSFGSGLGTRRSLASLTISLSSLRDEETAQPINLLTSLRALSPCCHRLAELLFPEHVPIARSPMKKALRSIFQTQSFSRSVPPTSHSFLHRHFQSKTQETVLRNRPQYVLQQERLERPGTEGSFLGQKAL
ncbi:hypothetical protein R1flu_008112 [Riccia fluitans]|uniref:Uncharacterized protein n=1 Tax=Riccia fluitans TaxID=41844 RepID=A0ABD1YEA6_9MARC